MNANGRQAMTEDDLSNTLATLHETLNETTEVDDPTRELLLGVAADIQRLLTSGDEPGSSDEIISNRVREMVVEFEVRHPHIGGLLERLSDGLANMGI
jgi:hypothetical protein